MDKRLYSAELLVWPYQKSGMTSFDAINQLKIVYFILSLLF